MSKFEPFTGGLPYTVRISGMDMRQTMTWCDERFEGIYSNTYMLGTDTTLWFFQDRKEAIWFALTWA